MSNVLARGGVAARVQSGEIVPIVLVPETAGGVGVDATAAIQAAITALPSTGGTVMFEGKLYQCNVIVAKDGVSFLCQGGGGDGNVQTCLEPFDTTKPALQLGNGTTQLHRFNMWGGRIYSQSKQFGLLLNGCADCDFFGTEIGGCTVYALRATSTATASTYFCNFIGCKFFAIAGMTAGTSRIIDLLFGAGFVTTINIIGGNIDGSALGGASDGTGPCAISIGTGVELWTTGFQLQLRHFKGVRIAGTGRWHYDGAIADTSDTPSTAVLVQIPGAELYVNSFVVGNGRINGQARNATPVTFDVRGNNQFGHGHFYSPGIFEPRVIGWIDFVPTFQATGPRITPIGGSPEGVLSGAAGDIAISVNNVGSSNTIFAKALANVGGDATKGWQRLVSGDFLRQTAPSAIAAAATMDLLHDAGDYNSSTGSATVTSLGTDTAIDSGRIRRLLIGGVAQTVIFTHTASPSGGQMYCLGQKDVPAVTGDIITWLWQGSASGWRMIDVERFDGRPFLAGRATYQPEVGHNLQVTLPTANNATIGTLVGASTPAEVFDTLDFDATNAEYIDVEGVMDGSLIGDLKLIFNAVSSATTGGVTFKAAFRRVGSVDLDSTAFNYTASAVAVTVTVSAAAGAPFGFTFSFTAGTQLDSLAPNNSFLVRIWREPTDAGDTAAADARIMQNSLRILAA